MTDDLVDRLNQAFIADAYENGIIVGLSERLIHERAEAAARIAALEVEVWWLKRDHNTAQADRDIMKEKAELMELENARLREALKTTRDYISDCLNRGLIYSTGKHVSREMCREDLARIDAAIHGDTNGNT